MASFGCLQVLILFLSLNIVESKRYGNFIVDQTTFLVCDLQDFLESRVQNFDDVIHTSNILIAAANIFKIPVIASKIDPKRYGNFVKSLKLGDAVVYERKSFSMYTSALKEKLNNIDNMSKKEKKKKTFVIFGVETHICVEQTASDLLKEGFKVHVVADAVSSKSVIDTSLALQRFQNMGVFVETADSVLFKLLKKTNNPNYDAIVELTHQLMPEAILKEYENDSASEL